MRRGASLGPTGAFMSFQPPTHHRRSARAHRVAGWPRSCGWTHTPVTGHRQAAALSSPSRQTVRMSPWHLHTLPAQSHTTPKFAASLCFTATPIRQHPTFTSPRHALPFHHARCRCEALLFQCDAANPGIAKATPKGHRTTVVAEHAQPLIATNIGSGAAVIGLRHATSVRLPSIRHRLRPLDLATTVPLAHR